MKKALLITGIFCFSIASVFSLPNLIQRQLFKVNDTKRINLNLTWENIDIQESDDAQNILVEVYCNKTKWAPGIKSSDSTVTVKSANYRNFFLFGAPRKCTVIIRLPSGAEFDQFSMGTTSGNIHTQTVISAEKFSSTSTSGKQSITEEVFTHDAIITSTSGNLFAQSIFGDRLKVSSTSGSIHIEGLDAKTCSAEATSGSIKISNLKIDQTKVSTTSGSITLEGTIFEAFDASSSSGMINLELNKAPSNNSRAKATSGSVFLGLPGDSDFSLRVQTTSGAFINTLTKEKIGDHVNYNRDINKGGATIILSSTSGRITVDSTNGITGKVNDSFEEPDIPVVSFDDPIF